MKINKKLLAILIGILCMSSLNQKLAWAVANTSNNEYVITTNTPSGKTGKTMSITFKLTNPDNGNDWKNVYIGFAENIDLDDDDEDTIPGGGYRFPFEVNSNTFEAKKIGSLKAGSSKSVSLSGRVRKDLAEGYYSIPITVSGEGIGAEEYINVWISKSSSSSDDDEDEDDQIDFVLGENQITPYGVYPQVMNFPVNIRNNSSTTAFDVTVSMKLSKDNSEFPFDINEGNYDRYFDKIEYGASVSPEYSMAIRKNVYSGFYPVTFIIKYRDSTQGSFMTEERQLYVHVVNKEEDNSSTFDVNTSTKARIIVDGFSTIPDKVYAGEAFELILKIKNASTSISASNILLSLVPEKITEGAVFTVNEGSSSTVINQLGSGATQEVRFQLVSRAGIDQRSYNLTIKEQFDSPEFKNATEEVGIDIPIHQVMRLNTSTIEVMPESIDTGSESNIMFSINNTGKVLLYNVTVAFEADSIKNTDAYVGNIKPGESGNVDVMLTGESATQDDGKIRIIISYEDEYGETNQIEKECSLFVNEPVVMEDESFMEDQESEEAVSKNSVMSSAWWIIAAIAAAVTGTAIVWIRKKKRQAMEKDEDDEIS